MSSNNNSNDNDNDNGGSGGGGGRGRGGSANGATWGAKVGYIGTGVMIGLIIYPFVRKAVTKFQPKMDKFFDDLTGKAEGLAERASDLMARAKENLASEGESDHDHAAHGDKPHVHSNGKQKTSTIQ